MVREQVLLVKGIFLPPAPTERMPPAEPAPLFLSAVLKDREMPH
jgi:hypothetical protein